MFDKEPTKVEIIDIGDEVCCDSCNADSQEEGGMLFGSYALCPKCTKKWMVGIKKSHEEDRITDIAKPGETFHDFVIRLRNGDNTIKFYSYD